MIKKSVNFYIWYLSLEWRKGFSLCYGWWFLWFLPIRKIIKRVLKVIVQFHFFQFLVKYLNAYSTTKYWNNLIPLNQSGFWQGDSCINQFISITHEIYRLLHEGYEVRGMFFDIYKAFDKVWHRGLILKVKENGINGPLLNVLEDFQSSRLQRVVLNGQHSSWSDVVAGVP